MHRLTDSEKIGVCERYIKGQSSEYISKYYNISSVAIRGILKRRGIKIRSMSEARQIYSINNNSFKVIDNGDKAYWLGFIMADGYIIRNCLAVILKADDASHLQKLQCFLGSTHPIKIANYDGYKSARLRIYSKEIKTDLEKYNIIQKKTFVTEYPDIPSEYNRHFIRGYFDGDGCIVKAKNRDSYNCTWAILGTMKLLIRIREILHNECGIGLNKLVSTRSTEIYSLTYGGMKNMVKIFEYLYSIDGVKLDRKYEYYKNIFNESI
jgi:hypothetical protein